MMVEWAPSTPHSKPQQRMGVGTSGYACSRSKPAALICIVTSPPFPAKGKPPVSIQAMGMESASLVTNL